MRSIPADPRHEEMRQALVDALRPFDDIQPVIQLCVVAQLVGQLIALQDQGRWTPGALLEIVAKNIEVGNADAIRSMLGETEGNA